MEIKGLLFDLDGVITETSEYHYQAWKALAADLGVKMDRTFNEQLKGVSRIGSLERILEYGEKKGQYTDEMIRQLADQKNLQYVRLLDQVGPEDVLPGIRELMEEARRQDVKIAVASASKNAPRILEALDLTAYIDYIADPDKVGKSKPAPDIFIEAARGIGIPGENCVGIEDAAAGIQALKAAKIASVGIGSPAFLGEADLLVPKTDALNMTMLREYFA